MEGVHYKTLVTNHTRMLKDGTVKTYTVNQKYKVKGYVRADGTRKLKIELNDEQIADILHLHALGVTKKKIKEKYHITQAKLDKILEDNKKGDEGVAGGVAD